MNEVRKPVAIRLDAAASPAPKKQKEEGNKPPRKPQAVSSVEIIAEPDVFSGEIEALTPSVAKPLPRRWSLTSLLFAALSVLVSLAVGLWIDQLIRDLFGRSDWLGWAAALAAALVLVSLIAIAVRELAGLRSLQTVETLRSDAAEAARLNNSDRAKQVTLRLEEQLASNAATTRGRALVKEQQDEIMDGRDRIHLAEHALLKPLDDKARKIILDSSKRVSIVTAVSPRALLDLAYVVYESARLIRQLAELYGSRPGTLGMFRLSRAVIAHLAVTGSIAAGDSLIQQLVGHGVAAKLSARLGEGVINGLMTARIGIAAMDLVRPLPFDAVKRPGIGEFLGDLTSFGKNAVTPD